MVAPWIIFSFLSQSPWWQKSVLDENSAMCHAPQYLTKVREKPTAGVQLAGGFTWDSAFSFTWSICQGNVSDVQTLQIQKWCKILCPKFIVYVINNLMWLNNQFIISLSFVSLLVSLFPSLLPYFVPFHSFAFLSPTAYSYSQNPLVWLLRLHATISISFPFRPSILYHFQHSSLRAPLSLCSPLIALCLGHVTYLAWNIIPPFPSRVARLSPSPHLGMSCVSLYPVSALAPPSFTSLLLLSDFTLPHQLARRSPVRGPCQTVASRVQARLML